MKPIWLCAYIINGYRISACSSVYVRETAEDSPLARINFQPSVAQCEIYLYTTFQGGNGSLGWKMCGWIWKSRGSNRVHNQAKLSSTYHRESTLTQQYYIKKEPESRQSMLQEWKYCHSCAVSLACKWAEFLYNATTIFCDPGGFLSAHYYVKKLKTEALSIMSFPVSFHTVVEATMESKSLGKDNGGYTNNGKG